MPQPESSTSASAPSQADEQFQFAQKVTSLPLVHSALDMAKTYYDATKNRYELVGKVEKGIVDNVVPQVYSATSRATPQALVNGLHHLDSMACSGLDALEKRVPLIKETPNGLLDSGKKLLHVGDLMETVDSLAERVLEFSERKLEHFLPEEELNQEDSGDKIHEQEEGQDQQQQQQQQETSRLDPKFLPNPDEEQEPPAPMSHKQARKARHAEERHEEEEADEGIAMGLHRKRTAEDLAESRRTKLARAQNLGRSVSKRLSKRASQQVDMIKQAPSNELQKIASLSLVRYTSATLERQLAWLRLNLEAALRHLSLEETKVTDMKRMIEAYSTELRAHLAVAVDRAERMTSTNVRETTQSVLENLSKNISKFVDQIKDSFAHLKEMEQPYLHRAIEAAHSSLGFFYAYYQQFFQVALARLGPSAEERPKMQ